MCKFCLFGRRLGHSYSPLIHNIVYKQMEVDNIYYLNEFEKEDLEKNINRIKSCEIKGANVTIPYKIEILQYIDVLDEKAKKIGSVNTVVNKDGVLYGYNTDYDGIAMTLDEYIQESKNNFEFNPQKTNTYLVLGYGGGAKSVITYLKDRGAKKIYVATRDREKTLKGHTGDRVDDIIEFVDYRDIDTISGDIIINTTPVGMYPNIDENPVTITKTDYKKVSSTINTDVTDDIRVSSTINTDITDDTKLSNTINKGLNNDESKGYQIEDKVYKNFDIAFDLIYNPLETKFLREAKKRGLTTINGLKMLVFQAISSCEKFMEVEYSKSFYYEIYRKVESIISRKNIISLVGMPGSGKSTIGRIISSKIGYDFIDLDMEIEDFEGLDIPEIFKSKGETYFRKIESLCLKKEISKENILLSTGGGSILKKENREILKKNSIVIYIDRDVRDIIKSVDLRDRPLLKKDVTEIFSLYESRKNIYKEVSDIVVKNTGEISMIVSIIEDMLKLI